MGKTYEALMRADKARHTKSLAPIELEKGPASKNPAICTITKDSNLAPYEHLKTSILSKCRKNALKTILFNGTINGGGCSTTAFNFAATLAKDSHLKILLVEVNLRTPGIEKMLQLKDAPDLIEVVTSPMQTMFRAQKIDFGNLYIVCSKEPSLVGPTVFFESNDFNQFLITAQELFDYVIFDAPPVPIFSEFRVLCSKVDGVVLVILSEKTRRQVVEKAKKEIEEVGGNILGVVLNERKYYIPKWLYKRL